MLNINRNWSTRKHRCLESCLLGLLVYFLAFFQTAFCQELTNSNLNQSQILFDEEDFIVSCNKTWNSCTIVLNNLNVQESSVKLMAKYTNSMYSEYTNNTYMTTSELKTFLFNIGLLESETPMTTTHDHSHAYSIEDYYDAFNYDYDSVSAECLETVDDLLKEYYPEEEDTTNLKISLVDFYVILPRLLQDLQDSSCSNSDIDDHSSHDHGSSQTGVNGKVWAIALGSVALISTLAVIGICIVPLMKHSIYFNRLISFLVALAVGTLIGDALLHLLPHSMGTHDHNGHDHEPEEAEKEKNIIYKSLVAVVGIYIFFLMESVMGLMRARKRRSEGKPCSEKGHESTPSIQSPSKNGTNLLASRTSNEPLLTSPSQKKPLNDFDEKTNGKGDEVIIINHKETDNHEPHSHHGHHHGHSELTNQTGIRDMAWMIIMGDGLHNFSDGLAIGAAFTSSIAAGLSTSLAVFCHELPHELGDFAILISAGMSIKQAILYNILSACCAFIGVVIGLAIGEFSDSIKLWILAITAGGFLYVALVGMLPEMLEATTKKDGLFRFVVQNIGLIIGVLIMVFIALYEDTFHNVFTLS